MFDDGGELRCVFSLCVVVSSSKILVSSFLSVVLAISGMHYLSRVLGSQCGERGELEVGVEGEREETEGSDGVCE